MNSRTFKTLSQSLSLLLSTSKVSNLFLAVVALFAAVLPVYELSLLYLFASVTGAALGKTATPQASFDLYSPAPTILLLIIVTFVILKLSFPFVLTKYVELVTCDLSQQSLETTLSAQFILKRSTARLHQSNSTDRLVACDIFGACVAVPLINITTGLSYLATSFVAITLMFDFKSLFYFACIGFILFSSQVLLFSRISRKISFSSGSLRRSQISLLENIDSSVNELVINNIHPFLAKKLSDIDRAFRKNSAKLNLLTMLPKSMGDSLFWILVVGIILWLYKAENSPSALSGNTFQILLFSVLAFQKTLPALQLINGSIGEILARSFIIDDLTSLLRNVKPSKSNSFIKGNLWPHLIRDDGLNINLEFCTDNSKDKSDILSLKTGETLFIVGPSGSGKSSILESMIGLNTSSSRYNLSLVKKEESCSSDSEERAALSHDYINNNSFIGYLPQKPFIYRDWTLLENIICREASSSDDLCKAKQIIIDLQLPYLAEHLEDASFNVSNLSGGELQRIALARVLFRNSLIQILDEPTTGLDSSTSHIVFSSIRERSKRSILIVVTHDIGLIRKEDKVINLAATL